MTDAAGLDAFEESAREWLEGHAPRHDAEVADAGELEAPLEVQKEFQAGLFAAGFAGITWPAHLGGQGLSQDHQNAFGRAAFDYTMPNAAMGIGLGMVGPTLLACGAPQLQERYIRPLLSGEEIWCQLFSEPGAGSDVASLSTRAVRVEGGWRVSGQKIWSSYAHYSDRGLLLARTDPSLPKHKGLSMFVIDMSSPGVEVRRIRMLNGDSQFNEVFIDDVFIPDEDLVGDLNEGWTVARITLSNERMSLGVARRQGANPIESAPLQRLAERLGILGDEHVRRAIAELRVREQAVRLLGELLGEQGGRGEDTSGRSAVAKLARASLMVLCAETASEVVGSRISGYSDDDMRTVAGAVLAAPARTIGGGTNEMLLNIIGERVLGLPKDPGPARSTPFNQLNVATRAR